VEMRDQRGTVSRSQGPFGAKGFRSCYMTIWSKRWSPCPCNDTSGSPPGSPSARLIVNADGRPRRTPEFRLQGELLAVVFEEGSVVANSSLFESA
jgi:hypothetical protein